jgi:hypothetical protein
MSRTYVPDCWVIVRFESKEFGTVDKILASFYGGYTQGNSWKLSSGIVGVEYADGVYTMPQASGSTYVCYKNSERLGGMAVGVYDDFLKQLEGTDSTVKIVTMEDYSLLLF